MAQSVGGLLAELAINTARWDSGLKSASSMTQQFQKRAGRQFSAVRRSVNNMGGAMTRVTGIIAAIAGPAAIGALIKSSMKAIDEQAKFAASIGATTEQLAGLSLAAQISGTTQAAVNKGLEKLIVNGADAAAGIGDAKDAFKALNINVAEMVKLPINDQFKIVADALNGVESQTQKAALAYDIFGRKGIELLNVTKGGAAGIEEFEQRAKDLNIAVSQFDSSKIEAANDAITEAKTVFTGLGNTLAIAVSPLIQKMGNDFTEAAISAKGFTSETTSGMNNAIGAVGFMVDAWNGALLAVEVFKLGALTMFQVVLEQIGLGARGVNMFSNAWNEAFGGETTEFSNTPYGVMLADMRAGLVETAAEVQRLTSVVANQEGSAGIAQYAADAATEATAAAKAAIAESGGSIASQVIGTPEAFAAGVAGLESGMNDILTRVSKAKVKGKKMEADGEKASMDRLIGINLSGNKKMAKVQQGASLARATMAGYEAITAAWASAPFPANLGVVALTTAETFANIAGIKGASFEGGGFTGMGARAGGIDGRGGFPAILHPRESVIDHTKGQGASPTVVNVYPQALDTRGLDEMLVSRRGLIANLVRQALADKGVSFA